MLSPTLLSAITGISSFLGLLGLLAYLYYLLQDRRAEQSVREIVEGEGLFNANQVLKILKQFKEDAKRLEALKHLTNLDAGKVSAFLEKIKSNVDVNKLQTLSSRHQSNRLGFSALMFLALALAAFLFKHNNLEPPRTPEVETRFDVKFAEAKFLPIQNKRIRAEIVLHANSLTTTNEEAATVFVGIITIHDEALIDISKKNTHSTCKETPSCLAVRTFDDFAQKPLIIRGGNSDPVNITSYFDLPDNVKNIRVFWEFYQREANDGSTCVPDSSKPAPTDGIPYLKVVSKGGDVDPTNLCWRAMDTKVVQVKL